MIHYFKSHSLNSTLFLVTILFILGITLELSAKEITTNSVIINNAPDWLKTSRVETVVDRMQNKLEWTIHRFPTYFYSNQSEFEKQHSLGSQAMAVTKTSSDSQSIHLGPQVNDKNFDSVFGHELVHVIFFQKYRGAIPKWLEEGLANHLPSHDKVDYKWLVKQPFPKDVRSLVHPYQQKEFSVSYHYMASQALAEMLDKKCGLDNLIRLSVQRKMEDYIDTYCEIHDINKSFQDWVKTNAIKRVPKRL